MLVILLHNHETQEDTTYHMHAIPRKGEIITLHDEDDKIEYKVTEVSHYAYTPNEMHQYAAKVSVARDGFTDWY